MVPRLEAKGLQKAYNVPVLVDFDFTLLPGEVHALVGSNGAGKSTFAKIVCGLTPRNGGEVLLDGQPHSPASRRAAADAGVVMVLQELNILATLSVAENLFLDRLPRRWGFVDRPTLRAHAQEALAQVGLDHLDPAQAAGRLGVGHQQLLEIAAALAQKCRVLILDEPTAALTATETEELFRRIRDLQARGVGIIYVSHKMDEIRRIADRATVLRDGRHIATHEARRMDMGTVVSQMAGQNLAQASARRERHGQAGEVLLDVCGIRSGSAVKGVDLQVRAGEVVGIAGLVGSGRTELLRTIYGADRRDAGGVQIAGKPVHIGCPADAVAAGIGMVPEDRKNHGLLLPLSIQINAALAAQDRFSSRGFLDTDAEKAATAATSESLDMRHGGLDRPVGELSGGNQQKAVIARWLLRGSRILLLDEPTRGVDVAAKQAIYQLLDGLRDSGKAILMVSSELPELMLTCDRILVMSAGKLAGEFTPADWSEERITAAAFHGYLDPSETEPPTFGAHA